MQFSTNILPNNWVAPKSGKSWIHLWVRGFVSHLVKPSTTLLTLIWSSIWSTTLSGWICTHVWYYFYNWLRKVFMNIHMIFIPDMGKIPTNSSTTKCKRLFFQSEVGVFPDYWNECSKQDLFQNNYMYVSIAKHTVKSNWNCMFS